MKKTKLYELNPKNISWLGDGAYKRLHDDLFEFAWTVFDDDAYDKFVKFNESLEPLSRECMTTYVMTLLKKVSDMSTRPQTPDNPIAFPLLTDIMLAEKEQ